MNMKRRATSPRQDGSIPRNHDVESQVNSSPDKRSGGSQASIKTPSRPFCRQLHKQLQATLKRGFCDRRTNAEEVKLANHNDGTPIGENMPPTIAIIITLLKYFILIILLALLTGALYKFKNDPQPQASNKATAAFLRTDTLAVKIFEEDTGLKLVDMARYQSMINGLSDMEKEAQKIHSTLQKKLDHLCKLDNEVKKVKTLQHSLLSELGLDNFCSDCTFFENQSLTCLDYANMLRETKSLSLPEAKIMTMTEWTSCLKGEKTEKYRKQHLLSVYEEYEQTKNKKETMQKIIANWEVHQDNFCGDCRWNEGDDGETCSERAVYLNQQHNKTPREAFVEVMVKSRYCRKHYYENQIEEYGGLCEHCVWGYKKNQTCASWVEYLMQVKKTPRLAATLAAMKHVTCRGGNKG